MTTLVTRSPEETEKTGEEFARVLKAGDIVALTGTLGSGKTRFVAGVCAALGAGGHFGSPTFTLINEYPAAAVTVVHADMYRISSRAEVAEVGLEEYFRAPYVCLIEWAEHVLDLLPGGHYLVAFEHCGGETERRITIRAPGEGQL
jgi:tRNA threonylcarbamoyladenosine biosynthesis protein TsaE